MKLPLAIYANLFFGFGDCLSLIFGPSHRQNIPPEAFLHIDEVLGFRKAIAPTVTAHSQYIPGLLVGRLVTQIESIEIDLVLT